MTDTGASTLKTHQLLEAEQSPWLDNIHRELLTSGELARMVEDGLVTGLTSNPTIFDRAISGSSEYDEALDHITAKGGLSPYEGFLEIAVDDIRAATEILRPVYERTNSGDGYVSLEVPPGLAADAEATVAEAARLFERVGCPNLMVKVPGTPEGMIATRRLIAAGVNINVTLLFSIEQYEAAAEAHIAGLEDRLAAGNDVSSVAGVASFFVSRVDTAVDALLSGDSQLRGRIAVANARAAYGRYQEIFSGDRWGRLTAAGAMPQRPLWASTGTKNPDYSDVLYVETLIGPDTVNTMPEATLAAALDHLKVAPTLIPGIEPAKRELAQLAAAGIDLAGVTTRLLEEGLASFAADFDRLLDRIAERLEQRTGAAG
ncbi:MAG TPA: transaldolase [Dehalococcoidia bacterium]|nr:transaldolase [Dehalococcoidia bacterium]